jgi:hypothetical protein
MDAYKATEILKNKMRKKYKTSETPPASKEKKLRTLVKNSLLITEAALADETGLEETESGYKLLVGRETLFAYKDEKRIKDVKINILKPGQQDVFVNSNLDFMPIACKTEGRLGAGTTVFLDGATAMITGVEEKSGFQPANIGSSEGILGQQVKFNEAGTPRDTDFIVHIDVLFKEGEGRTYEGIRAAHKIADTLLEQIRSQIRKSSFAASSQEFLYDTVRASRKKVFIVKLVSGLGNMYETGIFPNEPGGYLGARMFMDFKNMPVFITANQCLDGAIHGIS